MRLRALLQFCITRDHNIRSAEGKVLVVRAREKWCTVLARRQLPSLDAAQEMKVCNAAARATAVLHNTRP